MPTTSHPIPLRWLVLAAITTVACAAGCDDPASGYRPFGQVAGSPMAAATHAAAENGEGAGDVTPETDVAAYGGFQATYDALLAGQTVSLADVWLATTDDHAGGITNLGPYLDAQYRAALSLGASATSADPLANAKLAWAKEGLEKLPLSFVYFTMVHGLDARTREGLDAAYAVYSFVPNEAGDHVGLYAASEEYAPIPATHNDELEALFIEARAHLASNTDAMTDPAPADTGYDALLDRIERRLLSVFANGVLNYLEKLDLGPGVTPDRRLAEGRLFWLALRPWMTQHHATEAAAITAALYPNGEAAPASDTLHIAFGLEAYVGGTYDGSAAPAIAAVQALLVELAAP